MAWTDEILLRTCVCFPFTIGYETIADSPKHGLTFDLLSPQTHLAGFKGHTASGTRPPIAVAQSYAQALAREIKPTLAQTHTHTGLINKNALIFSSGVGNWIS